MSADRLGPPNTPPGGASRRSRIDSLFARKADTPFGTVIGDKDRVRTGAIAAMGTSLLELAASASLADDLKRRVASGATIVEIDTGNIDASMVTDRLPADVDPDFDELVRSMRDHGQQVPVLVRPSPCKPDRFQIAYGRRRARAAAELGIRVKAIVRPLSDDELVIAQGKENLDRRDLSYIEKAIFARRLEDQGFERPTIQAALSTDKADLSRYIALARSLPERVILAVGPAGKAGRARWACLAERLGTAEGERLVDAEIGSDKFRRLDSNSRFNLLLAATEGRLSTTGLRRPKPRAWTNTCGQRAGRIEERSDRTILTIDDTVVPDFGRYVVDRLDDLYTEFLKRNAKERRG